MAVNWQKALIDAGGPILKGLIEKGVGGGIKGVIAGKLADAALETLGEMFNTSPTPEAIGEAIERDPVGAPVIVRDVEAQVISSMEMGAGDMTGYYKLLEADQKSEGLLTRLWRPLFAVNFTLVMFAIGVLVVFLTAVGRLDDIERLLAAGTTFLSFYIVASCAVIGVQIYQREKTTRETSGL